jgi:hypothetical protein
MGMITEYFIATPELAAGYAEVGPNREEVPTLFLKWVEPAGLGSMLWAIIEGVPAEAASFSAVERVLWISDEGEAGLVQVADGFVRALAALPDERIAAVAELWATDEQWGKYPPQSGALVPAVADLRDLARQVSNDQHMFVWVSM